MEEAIRKEIAMNRIYQALIVVMAIVIAFLWIDSCNASKKSEELYNRIGEKKKPIQQYKDVAGRSVEYVPVQKFEDVKQIEGLKNKLDSMKIKYAWLYSKYKTEFRVDTISFTLSDSIPCPPFSRDFMMDSSYLKLSASISNTRFKINSLVIPNDLVIVIGERKYKWYQFNKKDTTSIFVQNSNTHVSGKQLEPYLIVPKAKKWSVGASLGYGVVVSQGGVYYGPAITIGISRNLFSF